MVFKHENKGYMETLRKEDFINKLIDEIYKVVEKNNSLQIKSVVNLCDIEEASDVKEHFIKTKAENGIDIVKEIKEWSKISAVKNREEILQKEEKLIKVKSDLENKKVRLKGSTNSNKKELEKEISLLEEKINFIQYEIKSLSNEKNVSKYFALLGDSGMGKTWSCMKISLELYKENNLLKPIYLDLRHFASSELIDKDFNWIEIVKVVCKSSFHSLKKEINTEIILEIIKRGEAFVIFDGLDEVTVHLKDEKKANAFIKELKEISQINNRNKVLFSCRTHYFRNIQEQFSMLRGHDRESTSRTDFTSLELLPFTWSQIEEYCKKKKIDFRIFRNVITSIHNLEEMSQRPYSLKLITLQIRKLENLINNGEQINSSDIYLNIIEESLNRDTGKHTLSKIHKPLIMRELSAYMWKNDLRELEYPKLDDWFSRWLYNNQYIAQEYEGESRDKLKADLRGATFIVRPNTNMFRFSHTSLQEFFLAWYLFEAFIEDKLEKFDISVPSKETLEFFVMLWKKKENLKNLKLFNSLITKYNYIAFELCLIANELCIDLSQLNAKYNLSKNVFTKRVIGSLIKKTLNFTNSKYSNVTFDNTTFFNVDFSGTEFYNCIFLNCIFSSVKLEKTNFFGCLLNKVDNQNSDFSTVFYDDKCSIL